MSTNHMQNKQGKISQQRITTSQEKSSKLPSFATSLTCNVLSYLEYLHCCLWLSTEMSLAALKWLGMNRHFKQLHWGNILTNLSAILWFCIPHPWKTIRKLQTNFRQLVKAWTFLRSFIDGWGIPFGSLYLLYYQWYSKIPRKWVGFGLRKGKLSLIVFLETLLGKIPFLKMQGPLLSIKLLYIL